jgi:Glycosyltransferase family 87
MGGSTRSEVALPIDNAAVLTAGGKKRAMVAAALVLLCLPGVILNLNMALPNANSAIDFTQFYAASRLAGTGHLYNWEELRRLEAQYRGPAIPSGRLPVVAYAMRAISWMPFAAARIVWLAIGLASMLVFALFWPGADRRVMIAALAWSIPVGILLVVGQDTPVWLLCFTAGLILLEKEKPRLAGGAFALCLCKYHLAVGLPVLLVAQKRWKTLAAGAAGVAVLLGTCFLIEGPGWPRAYLEVIRKPIFSVADSRMPNLRGVAYWLPNQTLIEATLAILIVVLLWLACRRNLSPGWAGALAAASGLVLGHHAYANDCALLIPLAVLALQRPLPAWMKIWGLLLLTPVLTLMLISRVPYTGQWLVVGYVIASLIRAIRAPQPSAASSSSLSRPV